MKKIVYVSSEAFFDVDFPIVKGLNQHFDLIWIPVIRTDGGWYTLEEIDLFCKKNSIKYVPVLQNIKYKNPKIILFYHKLLRTIQSQKADLIYFEYFGVPLLHFLTPLYLNLNKIVIAIHDVEQHYKIEYGKLKSFYFNYIMKRFRHFQVFSENQWKLFMEKYPNKSVFSADLYLKDFGPPSQTRNNEKINFIFFGIIRKNKGLDIIIEAFNRISEDRKDFTVTIAGDTKDWDSYGKRIKDDSLYHLKIRKINNSEIPDLLATAHYMLLPYRDVTQSGVLLTAYNYKLPVIASNLEGFREYISEGYNGFLIEPNSVESLIDKIRYVMDNHNKVYPQVVNNLCNFIEEKINIEKITKKYCIFFNKVIES